MTGLDPVIQPMPEEPRRRERGRQKNGLPIEVILRIRFS
jgi:hypothetical protein